MKTLTPIDATIAITYKCNSRCRMCNIWQTENPKDLPLEYFYNLTKDLKYINLSGGEPFLREDLPEIVRIVKKASPEAQIIISSNGLAADLIAGQMVKILAIDPEVGIRISIDGIKDTHDAVRGISGIYDNAMKTIARLKELGVKNLGMSFTIMDFNVKELKDVYEMSKKMNLQLALALVQNSEIYFNKNSNKINSIDETEKVLNYVISEELRGWNIKRWLRAYYDYGLLYFAKTGKRLLPSGAGHDSLFIDPNGDIYPSNLINIKMGNICTGKLSDIWQSSEALKARDEMKNKNIIESWIICTIRGEMRKHKLDVLRWVLVNKFKI